MASKKGKCSFGRRIQLPLQPLPVPWKSFHSWNYLRKMPGGQHEQVTADAQQNK